MKAAVVNILSNIVENIIVANANIDQPPEGCFLVSIIGVSCNIGWIYDPNTGAFTDPYPEPLVGLE